LGYRAFRAQLAASLMDPVRSLHALTERARDHLLVTAVEPGSEFLEDLGSGER